MGSILRYVNYSSWNEELFLSDCHRYFEIKEMPNPVPQEIKDLEGTWAYQTDEYIEESYSKMIDAFYNSKIPTNYFVLVYYYSWQYSISYGFNDGANLNELLQKIILKIQDDPSVILIDETEDISNIMGTEYKGKIQEILSAINVHNDKLSQIDLKDSLKDPTKLLTNEKLELIRKESLTDKCFLTKIDLEALVDTISFGDNQSVEKIRELFHEVYGFSNIKDFFEADKLSMVELKKKLDDLSTKVESKTKQNFSNGLAMIYQIF